jgi:hypothetical protein
MILHNTESIKSFVFKNILICIAGDGSCRAFGNAIGGGQHNATGNDHRNHEHFSL